MPASALRSATPERWFAALAAVLLGAVVLIPRLPAYAAAPGIVAPALAFDLVVGLPLLGYLFLVRTGRADALVLAPLLVLAVVVAEWLIPSGDLDLSGWGAAILLTAEVLVLTTLALRGPALRRDYRAELARHVLPRDALRAALGRALGPRLASVLVSEFGALWYATAGWRRPRPPRRGRAFTVHRGQAWPALLAALLLGLVVETTILHLVVSTWSGVVAWLLTALGLYSGAWLLGDFHAARHNPVIVTEEAVLLRLGLRWQADVPLDRIRAVEREAPDAPALKLSFMGRPTVWIDLGEPTSFEGPYGLRRATRWVGVGADDAEGLRTALRAG